MPPTMKQMSCLTLLALVLTGLLAPSSLGWNPPDGPNLLYAYSPADKQRFKPETHGVIVLEAINVLEGDDRAEAAKFFKNYRQQLLDGARQADTSVGMSARAA